MKWFVLERKKTKKQLEDCVLQVYKHYADKPDRPADENGVFDVDVTYDGKFHPYFFLHCTCFTMQELCDFAEQFLWSAYA